MGLSPVGTGRAPSARDNETDTAQGRAAARPPTSGSNDRADAPRGVPTGTALERLIREASAHSLWPLMLGLDYATLELFCAVGPHHDLARFGSEVFRPSPRQVDLLIVGGLVTRKMAPVIRRLWEAMAEPRFVMALGAGAISGAPFADSYAVAGGVDNDVPVDVYVPGDPPRPEAVIDGILRLRDAIRSGEVG